MGRRSDPFALMNPISESRRDVREILGNILIDISG